MITRRVLLLSLQCLDENNFLQKRARRAAGHMFMWQLHLHNLKSHMIFFPPFLWNWQLAVYRLRTTMKAAKLFHPSVFTPTIFPSLYYDYDCAALKQSLPCLKDPLPAPAGPAVPRCAFGAALQQAEVLGSSNWEQAILSAAVHRPEEESPLSLGSVPALVPPMELAGTLLHTGQKPRVCPVLRNYFFGPQQILPNFRRALNGVFIFYPIAASGLQS